MDLQRFTVTLADDDVDPEEAADTGRTSTHHVTVLHVDQLLAEQAGMRLGLPPAQDAPFTGSALWVWAALRRRGVGVGEFPVFKARLIDVSDPARTAPEEGQPAEVTADPTDPAPDTTSP